MRLNFDVGLLIKSLLCVFEAVVGLLKLFGVVGLLVDFGLAFLLILV